MAKAKQSQTSKPRLPIIVRLREVWLSSNYDKFDGSMLWSIASVCFFGFFQDGEL